jgi:hypothetical protein
LLAATVSCGDIGLNAALFCTGLPPDNPQYENGLSSRRAGRSMIEPGKAVAGTSFTSMSGQPGIGSD